MSGFPSNANVIGIMAEVITHLSQVCQPKAVTAENLKTNPSSNANAYAIIAGGEVKSIVLVNGGSGYLSAPTVTLTGGNGSGDTTATATSTITNGVVTGFTITNAGTGFDEPPAVAIGDSPSSTTITGDGTTKTFNGGLGSIPVSPASLSIGDQDSIEVFTDLAGSGTLTSNLGGTGTINYQTGVVSLTFNTAPLAGKNIRSNYTFGRYSQFKVIRNTSSFGGNAVELNLVDNFTGLPYQFVANFQRMDQSATTKS